MASLNFNANEVEPAGSFEPLPAGEYLVIIINSDMMDTKAGDGQYLSLEMQVIDGEYKNRKLFDRLNLKNKNQKTVDIAEKVLSSICRSVGVMVPRDSAELHDKPLKIKVSVMPSNRFEGDDGKQNVIRAYMPKDGKLNTSTTKQSIIQPPRPAAATANAADVMSVSPPFPSAPNVQPGTLPWAKK